MGLGRSIPAVKSEWALENPLTMPKASSTVTSGGWYHQLADDNPLTHEQALKNAVRSETF